MPKLGESVTEGTITTWLVKEGDIIKKYDPIAEVMTDKVNAEVPSSFAGKIIELVAKEGDVIAVDDLICYIETESTAAVGSAPEKEKVQQTSVNHQNTTQVTKNDQSMKNRYSPAVLTLANEHNLDLTQIEGTGLGGRITRKDIKRQLEQIPPSESTHHNVKEERQSTNHQVNQGDIEIPVQGIRKVIANNVTKSINEIP